MKKIHSIISFFLVMVFLTSCSSYTYGRLEQKAPLKQAVKLNTAYRYTMSYIIDDKDGMAGSRSMDMTIPYTAYITDDLIVIDNKEYKHPKFKAIRVKAYDYFLTKYKINPQSIGIEAETLVVYSLLDQTGLSLRFIKLSDDKILYDNGKTLDLLETVDVSEVRTKVINYGQSDYRDYDANGVLLGLRYNRKIGENSISSPYYETYWIFMDEKNELKVYRINNILIPRKEFHLLEVEKQENDERIVETIKSSMINNRSNTVKQVNVDEKESRFVDITFISDRYISYIEKTSLNKTFPIASRYITNQLANIDSSKSIPIEDILGMEAKNTYDSISRDRIKDINNNGDNLLGAIDSSSYILRRQDGKWIFEGLIKGDEPISKDLLTFKFNAKTENQFFNFDKLLPRIDKIRDRDASVLDAVSSPGLFFTVVKDEGKLSIYRKTDNNTLEKEPIKVLSLPDYGDIIMSEWATSSETVKYWSDTIKLIGVEIK